MRVLLLLPVITLGCDPDYDDFGSLPEDCNDAGCLHLGEGGELLLEDHPGERVLQRATARVVLDDWG